MVAEGGRGREGEQKRRGEGGGQADRLHPPPIRAIVNTFPVLKKEAVSAVAALVLRGPGAALARPATWATNRVGVGPARFRHKPAVTTAAAAAPKATQTW